MRADCSIEITLEAGFEQEEIYKILLSGATYGFRYWDYLLSDLYNTQLNLITAQEATKQIMKLYMSEAIGGACVFTHLEDETSVFIWFHKDENEMLVFSVGSFGANCRKKGNNVDLSYYVPYFLQFCDDFVVHKIEALFMGS
jgi:hypothetical protein